MKMFKKYVLLPVGAGIIALGCGGGDHLGNAQALPEKPSTAQICGTLEPTLQERVSAQALKAGPVREAGGNITVPVYVHIITDSAGAGDVSNAVVNEQIAAMNRAYAGQQASGAYNTSYRFTLAGVDRTANDAWYLAARHSPDEVAMMTTLRQGSADDLNMYVRPLPYPLGGYATWPWNVPNLAMDGITVHTGCMPGGNYPNFNTGDVAAHEAGHWLGAYHTYHNGCTTEGDYVSDTPAHASATGGCPTTAPDTCTGGRFKGVDPIRNFMNSVFESCMTQFTKGQNDRMDVMYNAHRKGK